MDCLVDVGLSLSLSLTADCFVEACHGLSSGCGTVTVCLSQLTALWRPVLECLLDVGLSLSVCHS